MNYFAFTYKYKDVTYKEKKETEIDILLLSQLAYLPMDNINFKNNKKYSLKEIADNIDRQVFLKSLIVIVLHQYVYFTSNEVACGFVV